MVHGVIAVAVAATAHFFKQFGVTAHIVANHEKCGLDTVAVEHVEHPRGLLRYGAVVEGEIYNRAAAAPHGLREK